MRQLGGQPRLFEGREGIGGTLGSGVHIAMLPTFSKTTRYAADLPYNRTAGIPGQLPVLRHRLPPAGSLAFQSLGRGIAHRS